MANALQHNHDRKHDGKCVAMNRRTLLKMLPFSICLPFIRSREPEEIVWCVEDHRDYPGDAEVYDADGIQLGPKIDRCNTKTGRVVVFVLDKGGHYIAKNGMVLRRVIQAKAPLKVVWL